MNVCRIGHATLIVEAADVRCLMDPILFDRFECDLNRFEPPIEINERAMRDACNLVVISHEHGDHFCLRSLNILDRKCPVVFPSGCGLIERALRIMGFQDLRQAAPGQTIDFRGLQLTFTPSNVIFPEMGVLFSYAGEHFWNCVDCELDDRAFSIVRQHAKRLDLMFARYQALIEEELGYDALGASFPLERHAKNLKAVGKARPRCVVPSSCGYRYATQAWLNRRGFPLTEREFLDDLKALYPEVLGLSLPPGGIIETRNFTIREDTLPFVKRIGASAEGVLDWRPDRGVAALQDDDPYGQGTEILRQRIATYLNGEFLSELADPAKREWRDRLAVARVVWRLEIVYPNGDIEERWLDFAKPSVWVAQAPRAPKMITSICASTLAGLRSGEITPYRALFTRRVVLKLYAASPSGITRVGGLADEPIARVLFPAANLRHVNADLARLGYNAQPLPEGPANEPEAIGHLRSLRGVRTLPRRL
jgi:hypothetical protein